MNKSKKTPEEFYEDLNCAKGDGKRGAGGLRVAIVMIVIMIIVGKRRRNC